MSISPPPPNSSWRHPAWAVAFGLVGAIAAVLTVIVAILATVIGAMQVSSSNNANEIARLQLKIEQDRDQREEEDRKPKIVYVRGGHEFAGGNVKLTFQNRSNITDAVMTAVRFEISDPAQLSEIERLQPAPEPTSASPRHDAPAAIPFDDAVFRHGFWTDENHFEFTMNPQMMIRKGETNAFNFSIENKYFAGVKFFRKAGLSGYDGKMIPPRLMT